MTQSKNSQKHRLFVGIKASDNLKRKIEDLRRPFIEIPIRWTPLAKLHITLVPPWNETDIESAKGKLNRIEYQFKRFEVNFTKLEPGPNQRNPRLIWIKGPYNKRLSLLSKQLNHIFRAEHKKRKLIPHITIARIRKHTSVEKIMKLNKKIDITEKVCSFSLIESKLTREGAVHEVVDKQAFYPKSPNISRSRIS